MTEDELLQWFDEILNVNATTRIIDMNYFSQYEADFGFRVGIEALH